MTVSRNAPCPCGSGTKAKRCCFRSKAKTGQPPAAARSWAAWLWPLGLVVAGLIAYANSFQNAFVFDDRPAILESQRIRSLWPLGRLLIGSTRPLVELTLALNYAVGRLDPRGYHLVNLLIHLAAALTLYGLCRRTPSDTLRPRYGPAATPLAFSVALLWLLHPLQTESVTYLSQRAEALMGCWALLTLYAVSRMSDSHPRRWTVVAVTACALGMLSKPVMVTIPILALLYDRTFLTGSFQEAWRRRRGLYLGLAATWALLAAVTVMVVPGDEATVGFRIKDFAPWEYAATQPGVVWHYLRLALWPDPLILDYDWPIARTWSAVVPQAAGLVVLLALSLRAAARRSPVGFLGCWIAGTLAPTSSLFPIADLIFEHRMYLPLAGLIGFGVLGGWAAIRGIARAPHARRALAGVLVLVMASTYAALTIRRNRDYRSELKMWGDTVRKQPGNTRARLSLGYALAQRQRYDEAIAQFNEILRLKPQDTDALNNLGLTMEKMGKWEEAVQYFREGLRVTPNDAQVHLNLGLTYMHQQKSGEAIASFSEAIKIQPRFMLAHYNLATEFLKLGQHQDALTHYQRAVALNPFFADARHGLGAVLIRLGRYEEAAVQCQEALRLEPDNAKVLANLGVARYHQGRAREAVEHLSRALALDPASREAATNLDVVLSGHPELRGSR